MASAKATIDHDVIKEWVESRGGRPARVKATGDRKDPGILRIDFPGYSGEQTLEHIAWDTWLDWFDRDGLAFLFQEKTAKGKTSRFNKLVARDTVDGDRVEVVGETEEDDDEGARDDRDDREEDHDPATAQTTVDHDEIRRWVEARGGHPASVIGTEEEGEDAGLLRIDFPGYSGEGRLEDISWDAFFEKFEEAGLAFLYQEKTRSGKTSRFSKLVRRERHSKAA